MASDNDVINVVTVLRHLVPPQSVVHVTSLEDGD